MNLLTKIGNLLKNKLYIAVLAGAATIGGYNGYTADSTILNTKPLTKQFSVDNVIGEETLPIAEPIKQEETKSEPTKEDNLENKLNPTLLAMKDNSWLKLNPPKEPKSRTYSGNCFGGGLLWYFGGGHASWIGNDVELYNPVTNQWTQATEPEWPAKDSDDFKKRLIEGGVISNLSPKGRPYTEHTYQYVCWNPRTQRFVYDPGAAGTWEFDPKDKKWAQILKNNIGTALGCKALVFDSNLKKSLVINTFSGAGQHGVYELNEEKREWKKLSGIPDELRWDEIYLTHINGSNQTVISSSRHGWYKFDSSKASFTKMENPPELNGCQSLAYDTLNKVIVALEKKNLDVVPWVMDASSNKYTVLETKTTPPKGALIGRWASLWYDSDHNVFLFLNNVSQGEAYQGGKAETWAYRFKKADKK